MKNPTSNPSLSDYLFILFKWKNFILINLIVIGIIIAGISLLIPNTYKASAVVTIPPESSLGLGSLTGLLSGKSSGASFGSKLLGGSSASEDMIMGILNSRSAIVNTINKFRLMDYYEIEDKNYDKAVKAFVSDISFDLTTNNFFEINVVNKNPIKSAEIANYFVFLLDSLNTKINSEAAKNNRTFIEKRYLRNIDDLKNAEDVLYKFQKKFGIVAIPEQLELSYKAAAEIESQLFQKQILIDIVLQQYGKNSPQYKIALSELQILQNKVSELKNSQNISKNSNVLLPFKQFPDIAINYLRAYRDVEIQSKILEVILPMYEQAKVEEVKNIPTVIVIDKATPPQLKYRPQRSMIVLSFLFLCFFISIPLVYRMESIIHKPLLKNPIEEKEFRYYNFITQLYRIKI
ncbi:MAG: hypothetical protein WCS69_14320 [Ignavibacteriaceae bacterium]|jgi:uncharacterized protein involved in exopolysaccharide biosynthesis